MSNKQQNLEEEVVVNQSTEIVEVKNEDVKSAKKAKAKKVLKVAGVALAGGFLGYLLGAKSSKKVDYYDASEIEVIDSDEN